MKRTGITAAALAVSLSAAVLSAPHALASPPAPPGKATTLEHLAALRVAAEGSSSGYDRDLFPHWSTVSGSCNTREIVLQRDGTNVQTDSSCAAISGSWYSPYDGATWTQASDVDIDHMVPLAEAWRSGASSWTTSRRESFANDRASSQLWAVTDNVNQSKGDQDPAEWIPSRTAFRCMYARSWTDVKYRYGLTVDAAEKQALSDLVNGYC
ncbi:HNH endonuclease family protein [Actinomadura viridis]|uniref:GmrSD restriction endonucleases C-terminal domain-containing protein n=1 Tax=Actinomadura viridis TaxID=58110 RepID=A0A931GIV4_9ACTN|nr:DUF1524 domain-containing protein [Actinomadura viridis]MBG6088998.1 hypothetical protein [Actinomadura viridis]